MPTPRRLAHVLPALSTALFLSVLSAASRAETVIGQVVDASGLPVAGIDLDFINQRGGGVPIVSNDGTDAGGFFTTTVPPGLFDVVFTPPGGTSNLATTVMDVGDVIWTPGDNSDATGTYAIIVPEGVYDFVVCPKATTGLLAQEFTGVDIIGDFSGGTHVLTPGVSVTGTGAEVPLCGDNTNAAGQYSIIAPAGVYDLAFTPPHDQFFGSAFQAGVAVSTPVTPNGVLPDCPPPTAYGTGFPGFGGTVPELTTSGGSSRLGNDEFMLEITGARGSVDAYLLVGAAPASIPLQFGTLLVAGPPLPVQGQTSSLMDVGMKDGPGGSPMGPPVQILALRMRGPILVPGAGQLMVPFPIPDDPSWVGVTRYAQVLVKDFGAMGGWSLTHGIQITFCE